jgi:hypothetical protein
VSELLWQRKGKKNEEEIFMDFETNDDFMEMPGSPEVKPAENFGLGLIGALVGAAIGGASIIGFSQLGYIASVSGVILAVCTLKGYELLGGKLSTKGIIVAIILVLVTPYLADRIDWAIRIMNQAQSEGLAWTFGESFQVIPQMIEAGIIEEETYVANLVQLYLFTGIGVVATLFGGKGKKKAK